MVEHGFYSFFVLDKFWALTRTAQPRDPRSQIPQQHENPSGRDFCLRGPVVDIGSGAFRRGSRTTPKRWARR